MVRVFIVDDEMIIRNGMRDEIAWKSLGMQVVGVAGDGEEALPKVVETAPHILITDIRMPIMDGMQLAEEARKKLPELRVVFLTGFADFAYTKKAIRIGAAEYLLKPAKEADLMEVLICLRELIVSEQEKRSVELKKSLLLENNLPEIRYKLFTQYVSGSIEADVFFDKAELLDMNLEGSKYMVMAVSLDKYYAIKESMKYEEALFKMTVQNVAEEVLSKVSQVTTLDGGEEQIYFILSTNHEKETLLSTCRKILIFLETHFAWSITIGIGSLIDDYRLLADSYRTARRALEHKLLEGGNRILQENNKPGNSSGERKCISLHLADTDILMLEEALKLQSRKSVFLALDKIGEKYMEDKELQRREVEHLCIQILNVAYQVLDEKERVRENTSAEVYDYFDELKKYETLEDIKIWLRKGCMDILKRLEKCENQKVKSIANQGMEYAKDRYKKPMTVSEVAEAVFVSPNYFSKVFKEEMGENFTEWLSRYRIEQAKKLIRSRQIIKLYEVASQVGFYDYKYFTFVFKKYAGITPKAYKEMH